MEVGRIAKIGKEMIVIIERVEGEEEIKLLVSFGLLPNIKSCDQVSAPYGNEYGHKIAVASNSQISAGYDLAAAVLNCPAPFIPESCCLVGTVHRLFLQFVA